MRDDDPLKYFPGYAEACAKAAKSQIATISDSPTETSTEGEK
jgi:hypothetical protein